MNSRKLVVEILNRTRREHVIVDILVDDLFRRHGLSPQDRAFIFEIIQGTLRWQKKLEWIISQYNQGSYQKSPLAIRNILESSLYQILFMNKTPAYAVVNEAVQITKNFKGEYWARRVNGILRNIIREQSNLPTPDPAKDPVQFLSVTFSHPEWLVQRWIDQFGVEETSRLCQANNEKPHLSLRVNTMKTTADELLAALKGDQISVQKSPVDPDFLQAENIPALNENVYFRNGFFSIQDESAGLVARLLAPRSGEVILDLCAAPGGKATHVAELARDRARVLAVDRVRQRLDLIRETITRLGLKRVFPVLGDATHFAAKNVTKILLDVPCSGLGVLAKRADLRWQRQPSDIQELSALQLQILRHAGSLVKKGGIIVYSTCTIETAENEQVVETFLKENPEFRLDDPLQFVASEFVSGGKYLRTFPHIHRTDGSFAARLVRST
jgi:16S rRNA (cytosine967-C5)-methyltransferase